MGDANEKTLRIDDEFLAQEFAPPRYTKADLEELRTKTKALDELGAKIKKQIADAKPIPRIAFDESNPKAFAFDGQVDSFTREDVARYVRQLVLHPDEVMSIAAARKYDFDLPQKIKIRRRGDRPMKVEDLPYPFSVCIVKAPGTSGFRFDPKRLAACK